MLIIKPKKNESIESMLKRYKRKVRNVKQLQSLRDRKQYTKPSATKRREKSKAIYIQKKNDLENN
jgi:small subunit ribosomal protein S21